MGGREQGLQLAGRRGTGLVRAFTVLPTGAPHSPRLSPQPPAASCAGPAAPGWSPKVGGKGPRGGGGTGGGQPAPRRHVLEHGALPGAHRPAGQKEQACASHREALISLQMTRVAYQKMVVK